MCCEIGHVGLIYRPLNENADESCVRPRMRVAVVGAGVGGLAAIKCCRDEGLDVVCFETRNDLGGLWNYTETVLSQGPTVARFEFIILYENEILGSCFMM